jgi:hypothetical protein
MVLVRQDDLIDGRAARGALRLGESPRVREKPGEIAGGVQDEKWGASGRT